MQLTMWRELTSRDADLPPTVIDSAVIRCDCLSPEILGGLYVASYGTSDRSAGFAEAVADLKATFDGEYGALIPKASLAVMVEQLPVSVVQTVLRAPWQDVQCGPFVIELFTHPDRRRRGLGRQLLRRAIAATALLGEQQIGLRVDSGNLGAVALYRDLGFRAVKP